MTQVRRQSMPPGKRRFIGRACPGADRFADLVARQFSLETARDPARFLGRVEPFGSRAAYEKWLQAYRSSAGTFLDHPVWGADRDLGGGRWLYGAMDDRFASNAARVFVKKGLSAEAHVVGKKVCVIGAWDGTECLLLRALGAESVDAIEESAEFCEMARAQYEAWDIPGSVSAASLYELDLRTVWQAYDLLYVPGLLYHLTDVVLAMVMFWGMLRPGGVLVFESMADAGSQRGAKYVGAAVPGWNWWSPTPACYEAILTDCGFSDGRTVEFELSRGWWMGTRRETLPALSIGAAGFSRPDVLRTLRRLIET